MQIKLYEQRKSRATGLVDRLSSKCAELRRQIDEMRKDSLSQHERFGTVRSSWEPEVALFKLTASASDNRTWHRVVPVTHTQAASVSRPFAGSSA